MTDIIRLRDFIRAMTEVVTTETEEPQVLDRGADRLHELITHDDWLPEAFAVPHPDHYQQYLLHCDPLERFSVVSFVWGPGQTTPVHDHTVWGLVGVLRGEEMCDEYDPEVHPAGQHWLEVGAIDRVSPTIGDIHRVSNALEDRTSISIHVYGANIGAVRRHVFDAETRTPTAFISGYSSDVVPNLWDRSSSGR